MCLFNGHQVRDLDHTFVGMDDVQRSERSPDVETINVHLLRIEALFVACFSGIWIGFENGEFFFYDALRFLWQ
jgi:hypothetical protein